MNAETSCRLLRANSVVSPTTLPNAPSSLTGFACISVRETRRAKKKQANWVRLVHHLLAASLTLDKDGRSVREREPRRDAQLNDTGSGDNDRKRAL